MKPRSTSDSDRPQVKPHPRCRYYEYIVKLHLDDAKFLDIAKAYYSVYCTPSVRTQQLA